MMKHISKQGLGCMSISEFYGAPLPDDEAITLISTAYKNGINFFDTADVYGFGRNEIVVGKAITALAAEGVERSNIILASKCGIRRDENNPMVRGVDNSYDYVKECCDKSLARLGESVGYIDLYYIHRVAADGAQLEETMRAMAELLEAGKIKAVGLSEANPEMIKKANSALVTLTSGKHKLAAVQTEYSLMTRAIETNGVLNTCRELGITFVAYSPLSRALLTDEITTQKSLSDGDFRTTLPRFQDEALEHNKSIVRQIQVIAEHKNCTTAQVALAWVLQKPGVIPIPGTTKIKHLLANIQAEQVHLSETEMRALDELGTAKGYRYTEAAMKAYGFVDELNS